LQLRIEDLDNRLTQNFSNLNFANRYYKKYLHGDIKREEVSLIIERDGRFLLKYEYFTSIIKYNNIGDVDYSKSKSKSNMNGYESDDEEYFLNYGKVFIKH